MLSWTFITAKIPFWDHPNDYVGQPKSCSSNDHYREVATIKKLFVTSFDRSVKIWSIEVVTIGDFHQFLISFQIQQHTGPDSGFLKGLNSIISILQGFVCDSMAQTKWLLPLYIVSSSLEPLYNDLSDSVSFGIFRSSYSILHWHLIFLSLSDSKNFLRFLAGRNTVKPLNSEI